MKIIKIILSNKKEFRFPEDIAEAILDSEEQIIKITDENGKWTGESLNKAHIAHTEVDWQETRLQAPKEKLLEAPESTVDVKKYIPKFIAIMKGNDER